MRRPTVLPLLLLLLTFSFAVMPAKAGILDLLWGSDSDGDAEEAGSAEGGLRGEAQEAHVQAQDEPMARNCSCAGNACDCCAALDLPYVDLGGPGCVSMRYESPQAGIALNISYGDSLLLSDSIKGSRPAPACLELLGPLAQLCARVGALRAAADGLRWCVWLEPRLLGDASASFALGCFRMGPDGMAQDLPEYVATYARTAISPELSK